MKAFFSYCFFSLLRKHEHGISATGYCFLLVCLLGICAPLSSQNTNPFDIQGRTPVRQKATSDTVSATGKIKTPAEKKQVTASPDKPVVPSNTASNNQKSDAGVLVGKNPFDVDHIPFVAAREEGVPVLAENTDKNPNVMLFWMLLFSCAVLAIAINSNLKYCLSAYHAIWNDNLMRLFHRETSGKLFTTTILLYLVFVMNAGAFVYLFPSIQRNGQDMSLWALLAAFFVGLYLVRHTGLFLFGRIFLVSRNTSLYSFTIMIFNFFTGILLIPFNFLLAFGPSGIRDIVLISAVSIVGFFVLFRYFRGLMIISEHLPGRFFQILLYLCTFELSPLLILIKTIGFWGHHV